MVYGLIGLTVAVVGLSVAVVGMYTDYFKTVQSNMINRK